MDAISPRDDGAASARYRARSLVDEQVRNDLCASYRRLGTYIRSRVRTAEDAEDVLHDYCVKVLRCSGQIQQSAAVGSWMTRVMHTTLVDYYRRRGAESRGSELAAAEFADAGESLDEAWCPYLGRVLPMMRPEHADLIGRIDFLGEARAEVAETLGISVNALAVRLFRARAALREKLTGFCRNECDRYGTACCFGRAELRQSRVRSSRRV